MSQNNLWKFNDTSDLKGFTLIIPSVAVGNVGQLACDLLISSLNMKKFASVYSLALIPVAGYDPYDLKSSNLSSSCESYKSEEKKLVILQLRAPLVFEYAQNFLQEIVTTFKGKEIKDIIVLTSSYAHERKHIMTSPFRYLSSDASPYTHKINSLSWLAHETLEGDIKIHGGGFAALIFNISKEKGLPCLVVYKYTSEGDNIPDAYEMVYYLSSLVPLFNEEDLMSQLIQPVSWKLLFGRPPPGETIIILFKSATLVDAVVSSPFFPMQVLSPPDVTQCPETKPNGNRTSDIRCNEGYCFCAHQLVPLLSQVLKYGCQNLLLRV